MVTVYLADCRPLAGRFDQLLPLVYKARREKAGLLGDTRAGRQSLAAGLLLCRVFGVDRCEPMRYGPYGKPYLPGERDFCLSHAGDYAALALGDGAVGVDVEREKKRDGAKIAERFFHPAERDFIESTQDPAHAFLTIWNLKESYLKAEGRGFSIPLCSFCILPEGGSGARMAGEDGWHFCRYPAPAGYVLSVCAREGDIQEQVQWVGL